MQGRHCRNMSISDNDIPDLPTLLDAEQSQTSERTNDRDAIQLGDWYWVRTPNRDGELYDPELMCVMHVGSNYVEFQEPEERCRGSCHRVHLDKLPTVAEKELDPQGVLQRNVLAAKTEVKRLGHEISELCLRLGVQPSTGISQLDAESRSLSLVSGTDQIDQYKTDLIKAEKKELPELFKQIRAANSDLAKWMNAESLPLESQIGDLDSITKRVKDRVFSVGLYAGFCEDVIQFADGQPAPISEKLHVMQAMCYMNEECLARYETGGMEFKDIGEFDKWLARPENRDRILPFPRCMVVFQVRRNKKERYARNIADAFINFDLERLDQLTFLYVRNGDRLYCIQTDVDFDKNIFPNRDKFHFGEPLMVNRFDDFEMMPVREYEDRVREHKSERKKFKSWKAQNPDLGEHAYPDKQKLWKSHFVADRWTPLDDSNVYLDDVNQKVNDQIRHYNRICTILQGLFDRSDILHPHPPAKLWDPKGFEDAVVLVYDKDRTLHHGDPPDFKSYCAELSKLIDVGSVTIGQYKYWYATLPRKRQGDRYVRTHRYGDPGPAKLQLVTKIRKRVNQAVFEWTREGATRETWNNTYQCRVFVPIEQLFNVSAYKPGDFRKFYEDPRTRAQYLQWANLLLTAEEFHAGNLDLTKARSFLDVDPWCDSKHIEEDEE